MALCGLQKDVTISQRHVICDLSQPRTDHSTNESENFLLKIHVDVGKFVLFPQLSHRGCTIRGGGGQAALGSQPHVRMRGSRRPERARRASLASPKKRIALQNDLWSGPFLLSGLTWSK